MAADEAKLAHGVSDGTDRLLTADEPLSGLHLRCGGELPGTIAVPELLELVRKSRRYGMKLARAIAAQTDSEAITAWIEVTPRGDGDPGCEILLRNWQATPLPQSLSSGDPADSLEHRFEIDRDMSELTARLDSAQKVLTAEAEAADLQPLATAMRSGIGKYWTDFVTIAGNDHRQPMHWRLLDGAQIEVEGSLRPWHAHLYPLNVPGEPLAGFELYLTSEEPAPQSYFSPEAPLAAIAVPSLIGRDITPVLLQPIARIIANAETIKSRLAGPLAAEYAAYAADIALAGQHLLNLMGDLADLEVVEAEDFATAPDRINLAEVARQAAGILGVRARERGITIIAPQLGETLGAVAEFRRVLQVLLNLVGNAVRYSPENSQVWLRLEDAGDRARVIVADQGRGLEPDQQARVFEKFERLGRSGDGGSGLGLYISRRLARAMGGELMVESAKGKGARFILDLPGDPALNNTDPVPQTLSEQAPASFQSLPGSTRETEFPGTRLPRIPGFSTSG